MNPELLDIRPRELKFTFELKKQSSCSVQLVNNSDQCVAFKVKTTAPKKYCVRPNTGIIQPKSTSDFTVTMQAQREAPPDLQCKDKFLIQSTTVPLGTTAEDIVPNMFTKDNGKYIEENKLKVVLVSPPYSPVALVSPPHSPVLLPINGTLKQEPDHEPSTLKDEVLNGDENIPPGRMDPDREATLKDQVSNGVENLYPPHVAMEEAKPTKDVDQKPAKNVEEMKLVAEIRDLARAIFDLNSKIEEKESKLREAEITIAKLKEERRRITREKEALQQELAITKRQSGVRKVQVGFPFLFVVMVALLGVALGLWLRS
ncbi:PREDICTED: vesicle-associated protein 1-1-like [Nelumbo nucifera]|uniref:Vesicle-associated protein 1-1-like n=2 Tax=Nelumbo nucifera TaxID=4432 RepID=A0A1U7Z080_NELNU|nr:PREDICTED: vesicle-associated protein 1-1-like [Nelumbo nucifera]DAD37930.1 TPA_asm: hypothetical protein HUJ06_008571 [Nelumbo nucifera]